MTETPFTRKSRLGLLVCLTGLLCLTASKAGAQGQDQAQEQDSQPGDPPTRVARISFLDGNVSFQPGGVGDWGAAAKNRPVTVGDKIWADKDSRVELQAGQAAVHIGEMTALSFLNLDQTVIQMRLAEGKINFRVRELREGDLYEVDTPNLAFTVKQAGAFRVDVSEDGEATRVTVIRGDGEVTAGGKTYAVHLGQSAEFDGADNNVQYSLKEAPGPDDLDRWSAERDLKEENSVSAKYISRDTVGYSDLDDNGTWRDEPEYGHVWYPNEQEQDPEWAPYSTGSWNYVGPWGWTWVDYSPWGFAPFHYGRWNYIGGAWGWCPGPAFGYPIYGPAFVGFLGGGFGFGYGVGWFPLGFGEPFHPWFRSSRIFVGNINVHNTFIRNTSVINNRNFNFANAHNVRAVTTTSRNGFVSGQPVNRGTVHVTAASLRGAQVTSSAGLSPTHQSYLGAANAKSNVARPPSSVQNRSVVARTAPARAASNMPVHTMNTSALTAGRLTQNRPSSSSATRTWAAQGNATDHGTAPRGAGSSRSTVTNGRTNNSSTTARMTQSGRPPSSRSGQTSVNGAGNGNRSYTPPQRANNAPSRTYTPPSRTYSPPPSRTYSAPQRSYSAPSHTNSAPSHSSPAPSHSSGGGGGSHGGGGGGGSSHGAGGSHGHR
jgi:hypothetical protein